jgi:hypothetical protein
MTNSGGAIKKGPTIMHSPVWTTALFLLGMPYR